MALAATCCIHGIEVYGVLQTRHAGNEEFLAVRTPERNAEVLVKSRVEVGPGNLIRSGRVQIYDTDADLRVGLAGLRIAGLAERAA